LRIVDERTWQRVLRRIKDFEWGVVHRQQRQFASSELAVAPLALPVSGDDHRGPTSARIAADREGVVA
jgi:hypothetical protein